MQTSQLRLVESVRAAVNSYIEGIGFPPYRQAEIESRRPSLRPPSTIRRYVWAALATCTALVMGLALAPAVVAQAERFMQAFMVVNGHRTQVTVQTVSLEQIRADMPFTVIAPAAIPPGLQETVNEVDPHSAYAQALFQYARNSGPPIVTIIESSAALKRSGQTVGFWVTRSANGSLPPQPPPLSASPTHPTGWLMQANVGATFRVRVEPVVWNVRGTRISLISPPHVLTPAQIVAIVRAMR
jgi:hypothetical protein